MSKLAVIIPAFNEAKTIKCVIVGCKQFADVIVANDGSTDNTSEVARVNGAIVVDLRIMLESMEQPSLVLKKHIYSVMSLQLLWTQTDSMTLASSKTLQSHYSRGKWPWCTGSVLIQQG